MLIAEMCRLYSWQVEYCLKMPAVRFFAMLQAGRKLEAIERIWDCDISAIPGCNGEYMKDVRNRFVRVLEDNPNVPAARQQENKGHVLDAASPEARDAMFAIFAAKKGLRT